ncbi:hypothetical protein Dimus_038111 [Dionaea muscipula]
MAFGRQGESTAASLLQLLVPGCGGEGDGCVCMGELCACACPVVAARWWWCWLVPIVVVAGGGWLLRLWCGGDRWWCIDDEEILCVCVYVTVWCVYVWCVYVKDKGNGVYGG